MSRRGPNNNNCKGAKPLLSLVRTWSTTISVPPLSGLLVATWISHGDTTTMMMTGVNLRRDQESPPTPSLFAVDRPSRRLARARRGFWMFGVAKDEETDAFAKELGEDVGVGWDSKRAATLKLSRCISGLVCDVNEELLASLPATVVRTIGPDNDGREGKPPLSDAPFQVRDDRLSTPSTALLPCERVVPLATIRRRAKDAAFGGARSTETAVNRLSPCPPFDRG